MEKSIDDFIGNLPPKTERVSIEWNPTHQVRVVIDNGEHYLSVGDHVVGSHPRASIQLDGQFRDIEGLLRVSSDFSQIQYLAREDPHDPNMREYVEGRKKLPQGQEVLVSVRKSLEGSRPVDLNPFDETTRLNLRLFSYDNGSSQKPRTHVDISISRAYVSEAYSDRFTTSFFGGIVNGCAYVVKGMRYLAKLIPPPDPEITAANHEAFRLPWYESLRLPLTFNGYKSRRNQSAPTSK